MTFCLLDSQNLDNLNILDYYQFDEKVEIKDSFEKVVIYNNTSIYPCLRFNGKNTTSTKELLVNQKGKVMKGG